MTENTRNQRCKLPYEQSAFIKGMTAILEHTHYVVLLAVIAVLSISMTLFLLSSIEGFIKIWKAFEDLFATGHALSVQIVVEFLEIVSDMLKAVIFYLVAMAFYSLFLSPLSICQTLGVRDLHDLESQLISVIVVILAIEFLEHFILWQSAQQVLYFGSAMSITVAVLVAFHYLVLRKS